MDVGVNNFQERYSAHVNNLYLLRLNHARLVGLFVFGVKGMRFTNAI